MMLAVAILVLLGVRFDGSREKDAAATADDATLMIPVRFGLGFMKAVDNRKLPGIVNSKSSAAH